MHELMKNYKPDGAVLDQLNVQEITRLKKTVDDKIGLIEAAQAQIAHLEAEKTQAEIKRDQEWKQSHAFDEYAWENSAR